MDKNINWFELKQDYLFGKTESVSELLKERGFKLNGYLTRKTKGWSKEREKLQDKLEEKTIEKTINQISETESQTRARQVLMAKKLQEKGMKGLKKHSPKNIDEARRMLVDGLREEREALGLNKSNQKQIANTKNNPIMGTRYAKDIGEMDYKQLAQVLLKLDELNGAKTI